MASLLARFRLGRPESSLSLASPWKIANAIVIHNWCSNKTAIKKTTTPSNGTLRVYKRENTSSEDSSSDSSLDRSSKWRFTATGGGGGGGGAGGAGCEGGKGGVGRAMRNGAGIFILFIKCKTYKWVKNFELLLIKGKRELSSENHVKEMRPRKGILFLRSEEADYCMTCV